MFSIPYMKSSAIPEVAERISWEDFIADGLGLRLAEVLPHASNSDLGNICARVKVTVLAAPSKYYSRNLILLSLGKIYYRISMSSMRLLVV